MRAFDESAPSQELVPPLDRPETPILHRSYAVGTWGCMTMTVWNGAVRPERVEAAAEEARRQCARHPTGGGFTIVIGSDTGLPPADSRRRATIALREMSRYIHCATVVVEGTGLLAVTTRSVISLMFRATARPIRLRVFASVEEAACFQAENVCTNMDIDSARFATVLGDLVKRQRDLRAST